jgi:hypothetical protein
METPVINFLVSRVLVDVDPAMGLGTQEKVKIPFARAHFSEMEEDYVALKTARVGCAWPERYRLFEQGTFPYCSQGAVVEMLTSLLLEIRACASGPKFLEEVRDAVKNDDFTIVVGNKTPGDRYSAQENRLYLNFYGALTVWAVQRAMERSSLKLFQVYPTLAGMVDDRRLLPEPAVESRPGLSPYWVSLAHELCHLLDDKVPLRSRMCAQFAGEFRPRERFGRILPLLDVGLGDPIKEHRAVFDLSGRVYSEVTLRLEALEPLRFFYQGNDDFGSVYEPVSSVLKVAGKFLRAAGEEEVDIIGKVQELRRSIEALPRVTKLRAPSFAYTKLRLARFFSVQWSDFLKGDFNNNNTFTWSGPSGVLGCIGQRRVAPATGSCMPRYP